MRTGARPPHSSFSSKIRNAATLLLTMPVLSGLNGWAQLAPLQNGSEAVQRIAPGADLSVGGMLGGHRTAWSVPENDIGRADPSTLLHLQLLLTRDAVREGAFQQRLADQQNPTSPYFHRWLTPAEIGAMYGPSSADIAAIQKWLTAEGLQVESVAPSGIFVAFSGSTAAVEDAFRTSIHLYRILGMGSSTKQSWRAPTAEPTVPAAFQTVIGAIEGLAEIPSEPLDTEPSRILTNSVLGTNIDPSPLLTLTSGGHSIGPADFATIYDLNPVYNAGFNGSGVRVAIIGLSQVNPADISTYETIFGLPAEAAHVVIPTNGGVDPGQQENSYQSEATLDVERVIGTAPGAEPDLVVSSEVSGGLITAISYNVQVLLDPIMTLSYISCEVNSGVAMTDFYVNLFSQGAAEGISTFVSAGDSGAAGCNPHNVAPPATQTLSINAYCSSGFVTCVGGTEFNDTANPHAYWANTNNGSLGSALGYIPEGVWNDPTSSSGTTIIDAGGGGESLYITKPAFQTGTGVPADGFRDTPDISFSASGAHDGYATCYLNSSVGPCTPNSQGGYTVEPNGGGTSASAPSMAGVAALLDQELGGPQGALNPLIYRLANRVYSTAFHDVTQATSGVSNCTAATASLCNNSTPGQSGLTGGLAGYLASTGFDLATGWGSLDVANFIAASLTGGAPTTTMLNGSTGNFAGVQTLDFSATVAATASATVPSGAVQFYVNGVPNGNLQPLSLTGQATYSVSTAGLPYGADLVTASYNGDSTFEGSTSNQLSLNLAPVGTAADALVLALTSSSSPITPTVMVSLTATFTGIGSSSAPAALITLNAVDGGSLVPVGAPANPLMRNFSNLSAGFHTYVATYPGDSTFAAVRSTPVTILVVPLATTTTISGPVFTPSGSNIPLSATVSNVLNAAVGEATPDIQFFDGTTFVGSAAPAITANSSGSSTATATLNTALSAGTHSLTAVWPGDLYTTSSTSTVLAVVSKVAGITITPATQLVTLPAAGATGSDTLTISSFGGFSGSANLTCAVTYPSSLAVSTAPTCSLSNSAVTLTAEGTAMSVLMLSTTAGTQNASGRGNSAPGEAPLFFCAFGVLSTLVRRRSLSATECWRVCLLAMVAGVCCLTLGCNNPPQAVIQQTTPATYTVSISGGSSGNVNVLSTVALTVQ